MVTGQLHEASLWLVLGWEYGSSLCAEHSTAPGFHNYGQYTVFLHTEGQGLGQESTSSPGTQQSPGEVTLVAFLGRGCVQGLERRR